MSLITEPAAISRILLLARDLSHEDRHILAQLLHPDEGLELPQQATVEEAITFFLADACSLGRAAELAGVTRWDLQEILAARGIPIIAAGERTADEIDDLADLLAQEGLP